MRKFIRAVFALIPLFVAVYASAGCTGSSPSWTSTPDKSSVQTCVNNAKSGDTIMVSAGSATWSGQVTVTKTVAIIGVGASSVTITSGGFYVSSTSGVRISGMTLNFGGTANGLTLENSQNFRLDHLTLTQPSATTCFLSYATSTTPNYGLLDHITSTYCQFETLGNDYGNSGNGTNSRWYEASPVGTKYSIYFEDSTFTNPDPSSGGYFNCWDSLMGGSYVIRFNTLNGCRIEAHGIQADNQRGPRSWEVYNNTIGNSGNAGYWPFSQRAGTGRVFHNTLDSNWLQKYMRIDGPRLNEGSISSAVSKWQFCDGLSQSSGFSSAKSLMVDSTSGTGGYRCRDQIGAGQDSSLWAAGWSTTPPTQGIDPVYIWKNTMGGSEMGVNVTCETGGDALCTNQNKNLILQNRDYYTYNSSFTGASGVGEGTLANRPSTCTVGTAYWATDQGQWNTKTTDADGQLYKCTATNTWSLGYIPYTYPHPLQGNAPNPPQSLKTEVH